MDDALVFATKLALQAGNFLRNSFNPEGTRASAKADHTVVTEADLAADRMITEAIREAYPGDALVTEEYHHQLIDGQEPTWIIDPLDGTTNYSLGLPIWGVSIARVRGGYPEVGALYFPMINELYEANRGGGAYLNNKPIAVRAPEPSQPMSFFACCSRTHRYYDVSIPYKPRIIGSCAYSFCMVARGSALIGFDATAKIWDLAAAWLLVEQAGGKIAAFEESPAFPITPQEDFSTIKYPTLASATDELFTMGQNKIQRKAKFALVTQKKG